VTNKPYLNVKRGGITWSEHRWVYTQAYGDIPEGMVIHHINFKKRDNRLENLQMMTHQEHSELHNQRYPLTKNCIICGGEFTPRPTKRKIAVTCSRECFSVRVGDVHRKIDQQGKEEMAEQRRSGMTLKAIAALHGVSFTTVQRIVVGIPKK